MDLYLSTRCPQCGADISFEEESTVIQCQYCGCALHVTGRSGVVRTYAAPRNDVRRMKQTIDGVMKGADARGALVSEKRLFFAPYWRIKGMVFRWIFGKNVRGEAVKELKTKKLDHTFPAYHGMNLGLRSLGIRPGALKLFFFDRAKMSELGSIVHVAVPFHEAVHRGTSLSAVGLDETDMRVHLERTRLIGERYSMIYFPFWMIRLSLGKEARILILDAVANQVTRVLTQEQWDEMMTKAAKQPDRVVFENVSFIPFKCPNCGWALPMNCFDIIHLCATCKQAWMERGGRFKAVRFEVAAPPPGREQALVYLPFWVLQADIHSNGQALKTVADLHEFSLLFPTRVAQSADHRPIRFYVPAVAVRNTAALNKLAVAVTQSQPVFDQMPKEKLGEFRFMGVFLPPKAATGMADILLCSMTPASNGRRQHFIQHPDMTISKMHLLWWPFCEQRLFLRDAICHSGIQKGAVAMDA
jgi:DNA-directed RNA polymerase subunit RPC12/RpoP/predicted Zn-ribbon and HTH transcriptional regulator